MRQRGIGMRRTVGLMALGLLAALAGASSTRVQQRPLRPAVAPGPAPLYVVGSRAVAAASAGKLDGTLADLVRHAARVRPGHELADLHALSPAAHFARSAVSGKSMVAIDAVTRGDPKALESALLALGLEHAAVYKNDVGGFLPVEALAQAQARDEVVALRAALSHRHATTGPVATQGDFVQQSAALRTQYPSLTGAGVTVGILSDSFNCYAVYGAAGSGVPASGDEGYAYNGFTADYASDAASGALPAGIDVVEEAPCSDYQYYENNNPDDPPLGLPFSDEGRAMLQILYRVAPGASLAFYTGSNSEADFASGIETLANKGAKVIADDLGYYDEPFFQDGLIAQAIDTVATEGVAYFSAAGNDQETPSYYNTTPSFSTKATSGANAGEMLLNFDATGQTTVTSLPVTIPPLSPGDFVAIVVEWDQPYVTGSPDSGGATSQIDLCITGASAGVVINYDNDVATCSGANALGTDPYQVMIVANPATGSNNTAQQTINIQVGLANGTAPGRIILAVEDDGQGSTINDFSPEGPTLQGHPGAAGAAGVGAAFYFDTPACGTTPATLEAYSSAGGLPILFASDGTRLATPIVRTRPNFVGPDGVNNTFLGYTLASVGPPTYPENGMLSTTISACQNNPSYPNFFGTSAATPHAAGIAALMLQANSSLTPTQIIDALQSSALAMPVSGSIASCASATVPNVCAGYGFIQATRAVTGIAPGTPTLTLAASSVTVNGSTTISWSAPIATGCTASGSWSGSLAASGSQTITPTSVGTATYTLACSNAAGTSATPASVKLQVNADPSGGGGGGGGGLGVGSLLGLGALWGASRALGRRRARRASATSAACRGPRGS